LYFLKRQRPHPRGGGPPPPPPAAVRALLLRTAGTEAVAARGLLSAVRVVWQLGDVCALLVEDDVPQRTWFEIARIRRRLGPVSTLVVARDARSEALATRLGFGAVRVPVLSLDVLRILGNGCATEETTWTPEGPWRAVSRGRHAS
jgi:hypothetical protein